MALHDGQHLDNDLRARSDHNLPLSSLLGIVDALKGIVEDRSLNHFVGGRKSAGRFSSRCENVRNEVSTRVKNPS